MKQILKELYTKKEKSPTLWVVGAVTLGFLVLIIC